MAPEQRECRASLIEAVPLSPSVRRCVVRAESELTWEPGQHVELFAAAEPHVRVPYSIGSAPDAKRPDILELVIGPGKRQTFVQALEIGARFMLAGPAGTFRRPGERPLSALLVATGTGVAPLRAMVQAWAARGPRGVQVTLLFGSRNEEEILFREEFSELARGTPLFRFEPTLSQAGRHWSGRTGRVQEHIEELISALYPAEAYVCGQIEMVAESVLELGRAGLARAAIFSAGY